MEITVKKRSQTIFQNEMWVVILKKLPHIYIYVCVCVCVYVCVCVCVCVGGLYLWICVWTSYNVDLMSIRKIIKEHRI